MPAPRTETLLTLLTATVLVVGCASNRPENPVGAAEPASARADVTLDDYTPPPPSALAPAEELDQLEASLAAYEQQLAHNEARLRAMGVRIAAAETKPEAAQDDRFAPPPPSPPRDPAADEVRSEAPASKGAKKRSPTKTATATTTPSPRPSAGAPGDDRKTAPGRSADAGDKAKDTEHSRCTELCDLAHATCDLEAKICDLAARHPDDAHYAEVCQRADDDCRAASEACNLCAP